MADISGAPAKIRVTSGSGTWPDNCNTDPPPMVLDRGRIGYNTPSFNSGPYPYNLLLSFENTQLPGYWSWADIRTWNLAGYVPDDPMVDPSNPCGTYYIRNSSGDALFWIHVEDADDSSGSSDDSSPESSFGSPKPSSGPSESSGSSGGSSSGSDSSSGTYPGVLVLVLDQTGSIGARGASRGIEIIDNTSVQAIGYITFGDAVCATRAITTDLAAVRAELQFAVDHVPPPWPSDAPPGGGPAFFTDEGGDEPENGVDAMSAGLDLLDAYIGLPDAGKALFLITDTADFAHQTNSPTTVNSRLNALEYAWLEFKPGSVAGGYAETFPETAIISHISF